MSCVLDDRDDVWTFLREREQVSARTVREFDGVNSASGADDVGHVRNGGARSSAEIQHFCSRLDVDVAHTTEHRSGDFRSERVPHTILFFDDLVADLFFDSNALLAVDRLTRNHVECAKVVLFALRDEDSLMTVLDDGSLDSTGQRIEHK